MKLFPRKCDNCGCGMDEGYLWADSAQTFCGTDCLTEFLYNDLDCFYTTWEVDSGDDEVFDAKGHSWSLKKCPEETETPTETVHILRRSTDG